MHYSLFYLFFFSCLSPLIFVIPSCFFHCLKYILLVVLFPPFIFLRSPFQHILFHYLSHCFFWSLFGSLSVFILLSTCFPFLPFLLYLSSITVASKNSRGLNILFLCLIPEEGWCVYSSGFWLRERTECRGQVVKPIAAFFSSFLYRFELLTDLWEVRNIENWVGVFIQFLLNVKYVCCHWWVDYLCVYSIFDLFVTLVFILHFLKSYPLFLPSL
jgi:hypothetical protein